MIKLIPLLSSIPINLDQNNGIKNEAITIIALMQDSKGNKINFLLFLSTLKVSLVKAQLRLMLSNI